MNEDHILDDYQKIFGNTKHSSLFTPDEEYETTLRLEIINSPHHTYDKSKLPFDGVDIVSSETEMLHTKISNIIDVVRSIAERKEVQFNGLTEDKLPQKQKFIPCKQSIPKMEFLTKFADTKIEENNKNFVVNNRRRRIPVDPHHYFYLKKTKSRNCDAKGYYDLKSNNFIIKKGSLLSLITSSSCYNIKSGSYREEFLDKYCTREVLGFRLNCDYVCDSPSEAVIYCLGRSASGWTEWKDEQGNTLRSVYRK